MKKPQAGFTIVELLIVIVVIAILAAISIVAYTGIQTRANNNSTMSGVAQYAKLFQMYATDNGEYPDTDGVWPCLDETSSSGCGRISGGSGCGFSGLAPYSSDFLDQLDEYTSSLPSISSQTMSCGGTEIYKGAYVENNTTDRSVLQISVFLKGNTACSSSAGSASYFAREQNSDTTRCRYRMPTL